MKVEINLTEVELRKLVIARLQNTIGEAIDEREVKIEVKTKHNYKAEWEEGSFRARISVEL